jgi:hypothetical protein
MNALEIPELRGRNPESGRRCIYSPQSELQSLIPKWRRILPAVLERFPEVECCVMGRVKPGPLERNAFPGFHLFVIFLDEFAPVSRMRELELICMRLFRAEGQVIRFAATRGKSGRDGLFPRTPLLDQVRNRGCVMFRRAPSPVPSRGELEVFEILLRARSSQARLEEVLDRRAGRASLASSRAGQNARISSGAVFSAA